MYPRGSLRPVKSVVKRIVPRQIVSKLDLYSRINQAPQKRNRMTAEFRSEVADYFSDNIRLLSQLTGKKLDHWLEN